MNFHTLERLQKAAKNVGGFTHVKVEVIDLQAMLAAYTSEFTARASLQAHAEQLALKLLATGAKEPKA